MRGTGEIFIVLEEGIAGAVVDSNLSQDDVICRMEKRLPRGWKLEKTRKLEWSPDSRFSKAELENRSLYFFSSLRPLQAILLEQHGERLRETDL